jgi:hypothetical protein
LRQKPNFLSRFKLICPVQSPARKYSYLQRPQINCISITVPSHRGATRDRHGRGTGCGGRGCADNERRKSGRRSRVVLTPRRWCQVRAKERGRWWQESPVARESAKETVKTIAQGMPDASAEPVCSCAFFCALCTRDRGCSVHPVFPAPSDWRGRAIQSKTRAKRAARSRSHVCRHCERSEAIHSSLFLSCGGMDCFACARNDGSRLRCAGAGSSQRHPRPLNARQVRDGIAPLAEMT